MAEDFDLWLVKEALKFDYSFTSLIFGTLALSIQFSPGMGTVNPWLLIASWFFLLVAALAGGNRIVRKEVFYRNNILSNKARAANDQRTVSMANAVLESEMKKSLFLFKVRQWCFLAGIFLNFSFAVTNYLDKAKWVCSFCLLK